MVCDFWFGAAVVRCAGPALAVWVWGAGGTRGASVVRKNVGSRRTCACPEQAATRAAVGSCAVREPGRGYPGFSQAERNSLAAHRPFPKCVCAREQRIGSRQLSVVHFGHGLVSGRPGDGGSFSPSGRVAAGCCCCCWCWCWCWQVPSWLHFVFHDGRPTILVRAIERTRLDSRLAAEAVSSVHARVHVGFVEPPSCPPRQAAAD